MPPALCSCRVGPPWGGPPRPSREGSGPLATSPVAQSQAPSSCLVCRRPWANEPVKGAFLRHSAALLSLFVSQSHPQFITFKIHLGLWSQGLGTVAPLSLLPCLGKQALSLSNHPQLPFPMRQGKERAHLDRCGLITIV